MDRPEHGRHRPGRARLRLPHGRLRDQLQQLPANFGVRALSVFDPNLERPYQLTYNVGISHELLRGTSVTAEWFHSDFKNLIARNNVARRRPDYTPVTVVQPDRRQPDHLLQHQHGQAERGPERRQQRSEHEAVVQRHRDQLQRAPARAARGIFGGTSTERIITNSCSAADHDPNLLLFCDGSKNNLPWITSGKLAGSYPLPW